MKREIDLTERNDFSSFGNSRVIQEKEKSYRHRSTPWKRGTEDESVPLDFNDYLGYFYTSTGHSSSSTMTVSMNSSFNTTSSWSVNRTINDVDMTDNTMRITINKNRHGDEIDSFIYSFSYNSNSIDYICRNSNGDVIYLSSQPENSKIFPTGTKKEIKLQRFTNVIIDKYKKEKKSYICSKCGRRFKPKPWSGYEIDGYNILCDKCGKPEVFPMEDIKKNYTRDKLLVSRWVRGDNIRGLCHYRDWVHHPYESRNHQIFQMIAFDIPSLSADMKDEYVKPRYPQGYREWDYEDIWEDQELEFRADRRYEKVYTKGKSSEPLRRREEPWQPHGRIRQPYDEMFDRMDWRDMLKLRLGELDGPLAKEPENRIHINEDTHITLNSFNHIDFDWRFV